MKYYKCELVLETKESKRTDSKRFRTLFEAADWMKRQKEYNLVKTKIL